MNYSSVTAKLNLMEDSQLRQYNRGIFDRRRVRRWGLFWCRDFCTSTYPTTRIPSPNTRRHCLFDIERARNRLWCKGRLPIPYPSSAALCTCFPPLRGRATCSPVLRLRLRSAGQHRSRIGSNQLYDQSQGQLRQIFLVWTRPGFHLDTCQSIPFDSILVPSMAKRRESRYAFPV